MRHPLRPLVMGAAVFLCSCAPTVNLTNPTTPVFQGVYGQGTVRDSAPAESIRVVTFNLKLGHRVDRAIALFETNDIHPSSRDYFGPAILSPWPIERSWKVLLPHEGMLRHQRRTATGAIVQVRGTRIRVYATHLEMPLRITERERRDQVTAILDDASGAPEPVIIAGDFNGTDIGRFFQAQGYNWMTREVSPTTLWFAWDHIFARGLVLAGSNDAGVVRVTETEPAWPESWSLPLTVHSPCHPTGGAPAYKKALGRSGKFAGSGDRSRRGT
jgi:hypothetical protein